MDDIDKTPVRKKPKVQLIEQPFHCEFCKKKFHKEKTMILHVCERKRRHLQRDEKRVQTGFMIFNRFYELSYKSTKPKTYEEFCSSMMYPEFVKFGSYLNNAKVLSPDKYVDYLVKNNIKIDSWTKDRVYEKYLITTLKTESVEDAVRRSITTMFDWSDVSQAKYNLYFEMVNQNRAVQDIRDGLISPWVVLNCDSGVTMLKDFNEEQLNLISKTLDLNYWLKTFKYRVEDVNLVKEICREAGIP